MIATPDMAAIIDLLENPDTSLGTDPPRERDALLLTSLTRLCLRPTRCIAEDCVLIAITND
jgi:hypothetical protein